MDYNKQAKDFCEKFGIKIKIKLSKTQTPPKWLKNKGDNYGFKYDICISKNDNLLDNFNFEFWDSINNKEKIETYHKIKNEYKPFFYNEKNWNIRDVIKLGNEIKESKYLPNEYSVLACLTKYDPETFEDFCSEYGYSDDSLKAKEAWEAVNKEWHKVKNVFAHCLDELREIN